MFNFRGNRSGLYEFFRGKAWVCGHALVGMAKVSLENDDDLTSKHYSQYNFWEYLSYFTR